MWRSDNHFSWKWIIEGVLTRPGDFMHYTTFMFHLFCYGQLFKEAMQQLIEVSEALGHSGKQLRPSGLMSRWALRANRTLTKKEA